mmetsp:Transcript_7795/g.11057  ORF Transcript_7795/g.11057 Transcript_7795/m.11057 type:complete len:370 (-) Transcript_7795:2539-3648(-)
MSSLSASAVGITAITASASICSSGLSSTDSTQVNATLRSGKLSSTLCLKGPRSTTRSIFTRSVSSSTGVIGRDRKAATTDGLWWMAVLTINRAARFTSRSLFSNSGRNWPMTAARGSAAGDCGLASATFRVLATILPPPLWPAAGWVRASSVGMTSAAIPGMEVSSPRHSATIFFTLSSAASPAPSSHCSSSTGSTAGACKWKSRSQAACTEMASLRAASNKYCCCCSCCDNASFCCGCFPCGRACRMAGRKVSMEPAATWPRQYAAACLTSSDSLALRKHCNSSSCRSWPLPARTTRHSSGLCWPTSPSESRASCCVDSEFASTSATRRSRNCSLSGAAMQSHRHTAAMHLERLLRPCLETLADGLLP